MSLANEFGQIDIYLFDQLLKGRLRPGMRVLDAGCGGGRNLVYLLRRGFEVFAADEDPATIEAVRRLAGHLGVELPADRLRVEPLEALSFDEASMDGVLSCAVLHFARDDAHFRAILDSCWGALAPGGLFFCRLASSIGMEGRFQRLQGRVHRLLDGSTRYLVDEEMLLGLTAELGGELIDPLKTTVVQSQRCMTTWVVRKPA